MNLIITREGEKETFRRHHSSIVPNTEGADNPGRGLKAWVCKLRESRGTSADFGESDKYEVQVIDSKMIITRSGNRERNQPSRKICLNV